MSVTEADVINLMDTALTEDQMSPFLTTAHAIVNAQLASSSLSTAIQDEIEKYLAAHIACVRSPFAIRKKVMDAEETYGYQQGAGLDATPYGQMVKMLDTTGILVSSYGARVMSLETIDFPQDDDD